MSKSNEVFCLVQSPNFSLPFRRASLEGNTLKRGL